MCLHDPTPARFSRGCLLGLALLLQQQGEASGPACLQAGSCRHRPTASWRQGKSRSPGAKLRFRPAGTGKVCSS